MTVMKAFGDRLAQERREKAVRERRDIGQKDVADAVGVSLSSISRWEAGLGMPRDDDLVAKLAKYFGVSPGWLHYGTGERAAPPPRVPLPRSVSGERKRTG